MQDTDFRDTEKKTEEDGRKLNRFEEIIRVQSKKIQLLLKKASDDFLNIGELSEHYNIFNYLFQNPRGK